MALEARVGDTHCRDESSVEEVRERVAGWEELLRDAVMVAL